MKNNHPFQHNFVDMLIKLHYHLLEKNKITWRNHVAKTPIKTNTATAAQLWNQTVFL